MSDRLKQHNAGARLLLEDSDLLIAALYPRSLNVHAVKMIVTSHGHLEYAEWITGAPSCFTHRQQQLPSSIMSVLEDALSRVAAAASVLQLERTDCDWEDFERSDRVTLTFRHAGTRITTLMPSDEYYSRFGNDGDQKRKYETAVNHILSILPTQWITAGDS